jgi:hypothetical protein
MINCTYPKCQATNGCVGACSKEPVAWMSPNKEHIEFSRKDTVYGSHTIPLYTSPSKREWVGLMDEEIESLVEIEDWYNYPEDFVRTVQSKLKEKNT